MAKERVIVPSPSSVGGQSIIASPFQFQTDGADVLRVRFWWAFEHSDSPLYTQAVTLQVRSVDNAGALQVGTTTYTLPQVNGQATYYYPLASGYLQTAALVWAGTAPLNVGPCYAVVDLVRGTEAGAHTAIGQLLGGYVELGQSICWPGSQVIGPLDGPGWPFVFVATPSSGATRDVTFQPEAGWVVRVRSFAASLITSPALGTRYPNLIVTKSTAATAATFPSTGSCPPSGGQRYTWAAGAGGVVSPAGNVFMAPMPDLRLNATDTLQTLTFGIDIADNWDAPRILGELWLEAKP